MQKKKSKNQTWIDVKRSLRKIEVSQLVELIKDLYQLSDENKNFLHARFQAGRATSSKYKKIISESLYPDIFEDDDDFDYERANKVQNLAD